MLQGDEGFCNYLYQGQTLDRETGLAYNRFRYYDCEEGIYISQDPIGLASGEFNFYNYVYDANGWVDVFGLHCSVALSNDLEKHGTPRPNDTIAHHMVGSGKRAKPANDILKNHDIHIDSHKNGVFLPNGPNSSAPSHIHTGRHTNAYVDAVNRDIVAANRRGIKIGGKAGGKAEVERTLDNIRQQLLNGTYTPLQR